MREALQPFEGQRLTVRGTVLKHSTRIGWAGVREPTILFGNVTALDGMVLTDHVWLPLGKRLAALDLRTGDLAQFTGRVAIYRRGMARQPGERATFSYDYGLLCPSQCGVVARAEVAAPIVQEQPSTTPTPERAATRLMRGLTELWAETGDPVSLKHLYMHTPMSPMTFLGTLSKQAKAGRIAFQANGRIFVVAGTQPAPQLREGVQQ
jgi:hypothetical protein